MATALTRQDIINWWIEYAVPNGGLDTREGQFLFSRLMAERNSISYEEAKDAVARLVSVNSTS